MDYYLLRDGQQFGPYTDEALRASWEAGDLTPDDLLWFEGAEDWTPAPTVFAPATATTPELATPRQLAFLTFMGLDVPPATTRREAAARVKDAVASDPSRLEHWNAERLQRHPELFAEEIEARRHGRAQRFLARVQAESTGWFGAVARSHGQAVIDHLDAALPGWDTDEDAAHARHFQAILAQKFPQLLTAKGRAHFCLPLPAEIGARHSSPRTRRAPSSRGQKAAAIGRGLVFGTLALAALWFARGPLGRLQPAPSVATAPSPSAAPAPSPLPLPPSVAANATDRRP